MSAMSDKPLITHLFTADPSAHVFNGTQNALSITSQNKTERRQIGFRGEYCLI
jgi:hypothetical protein